MENVLVLSDIHGGISFARRALSAHPECKSVIFLGDGARHICRLSEEFSDRTFYAVMGNCDTPLDGVREREILLEISSHRIFVCHGHTQNVKFGRGVLLDTAREKGCDIALYGHTHIPHDEYVSDFGVYLFNPGSIGAPHDARFTFGILSLDEKNVLFSIGEV